MTAMLPRNFAHDGENEAAFPGKARQTQKNLPRGRVNLFKEKLPEYLVLII